MREEACGHILAILLFAPMYHLPNVGRGLMWRVSHSASRQISSDTRWMGWLTCVSRQFCFVCECLTRVGRGVRGTVVSLVWNVCFCLQLVSTCVHVCVCVCGGRGITGTMRIEGTKVDVSRSCCLVRTDFTNTTYRIARKYNKACISRKRCCSYDFTEDFLDSFMHVQWLAMSLWLLWDMHVHLVGT
jgi:hypothetical protein